MEQYGVHENKWLTEAAAGRMAAKLLEAGFAFDFISDAQLERLKVDDRTFIAPGGGATAPSSSPPRAACRWKR